MTPIQIVDKSDMFYGEDQVHGLKTTRSIMSQFNRVAGSDPITPDRRGVKQCKWYIIINPVGRSSVGKSERHVSIQTYLRNDCSIVQGHTRVQSP